MPKIEEDGKSWLRRSKLYKGVVEPYKEKTGLKAKGQSSVESDEKYSYFL